MASRQKLRNWLAIGAVVLVGLVTLYSIFEYTLVSELREYFAGAATKEGIALGQILFDTRGCGACHALSGVSQAAIGPDLTTIGAIATAGGIRDAIVDPDAIISGRCPNRLCQAGLMPAYGDLLSDREIDALVSFLLQHNGDRPEKHD